MDIWANISHLVLFTILLIIAKNVMVLLAPSVGRSDVGEKKFVCLRIYEAVAVSVGRSVGRDMLCDDRVIVFVVGIRNTNDSFTCARTQGLNLEQTPFKYAHGYFVASGSRAQFRSRVLSHLTRAVT